MSEFSTVLKQKRLEKGMSQEEFATFLGTSKQNISRYELGEVTPKISTAARIAEKLGITLTQLNGGEAESPAAQNELQLSPEAQMQLDQITAIFSRITDNERNRLLGFAEGLDRSQAASPDSED